MKVIQPGLDIKLQKVPSSHWDSAVPEFSGGPLIRHLLLRSVVLSFFFPFIKIKITLFFVFIMKLHNIPPFCCYSFGWLCQRSKLIHPSTFWDSSFFRYQAKTPPIHLLCHFILFLGNLGLRKLPIIRT